MTDRSRDPVPVPVALAALAEEMTGAAAEARTMALALFKAEIEGAMARGAAGPAPRGAEALARVDAEVEASFDNVPL